jgi:polysaccharide export outer membrane protein
LAKQYTTDIDVSVGIAGVKEEPQTQEPPLYPSIFVTGEVARPGKYEYRQSVNVLQAIALAGGLSPFAADKRIKIRRKANGEEHLYDFNYDAFTSGEDMSGNIVLKGGDVVIVPERKLFE